MTIRRGVAALLLLGVVGCTGLWQEGRDPSQPWASMDRPNEVQIEVKNMNFADARLVAITDGQRRALGTVIGKQDARFTMPWDFHQSLQIEINLTPGPTCTTEVLPVDPGDILDLEISPVLFDSPACRRTR